MHLTSLDVLLSLSLNLMMLISLDVKAAGAFNED